jgi:hypothetical protein
MNWFTMSFWLEVRGGILARPPCGCTLVVVVVGKVSVYMGRCGELDVLEGPIGNGSLIASEILT